MYVLPPLLHTTVGSNSSATKDCSCPAPGGGNKKGSRLARFICIRCLSYYQYYKGVYYKLYHDTQTNDTINKNGTNHLNTMVYFWDL